MMKWKSETAGMTMYHKGVDYFFVTDQTKRTDKLACNIAVAMMRSHGRQDVCSADILPSTIRFVKERLRPATLTEHYTENRGSWYSIHEENACSSGLVMGQDVFVLEV